MTSTQSRLIHDRIWDLISDYANIRNELEDALNDFRYLYEELEFGMADIHDELDSIEEHISTASRSLKRFRIPAPAKDILPFDQDADSPEGGD